MKAAQVIRRLDRVSTHLYQEIIRIEKLRGDIDDLVAACGTIPLQYDESYDRAVASVQKAEEGLSKLSWQVSGHLESVQEAAWLCDEIEDHLEELT